MNRIEAHAVGKRYARFAIQRPRKVKEALFRGMGGLRPVDTFWALRQVSVEVAAGKMLGVIGTNGSGKSTLLKLIGGLSRPDEGTLVVRGRVVGLLELGTGFHPDLTGRENVFINGVVTGLTRREVSEQFDSIVAFAGVEAFVDSPLRTYSSGMRMRLGFAVMAHTRPEVLLIDEVLAVGDLAFQKKCVARIATFKADGCAVVLVSHNLEAVTETCDEVLWLQHGNVVARGPAEPTVTSYRQANEDDDADETGAHDDDGG